MNFVFSCFPPLFSLIQLLSFSPITFQVHEILNYYCFIHTLYVTIVYEHTHICTHMQPTESYRYSFS